MALTDKLYEDLQRDLTQLSYKRDPELDSCRLPKSDDIQSFKGCVENIPTFSPDDELKRLQQLADSLIDVPAVNMEELNACTRRIASCCDDIRQDSLQPRDFYTPLYDFCFSLASFVVYETIAEKARDMQITLQWETLRDGRLYPVSIPRLKSYYCADGRRKSPLHDALLRLLVDVVQKKTYKQHQPLRVRSITKEWADSFKITEDNVPEDPADADLSRLVFLRLSSSFFLTLRSFLRQLYVKTEQNYQRFRTPFESVYGGIPELIHQYLEQDIEKHFDRPVTLRKFNKYSLEDRRANVTQISDSVRQTFTSLVESLDAFDFEQKKYRVLRALSGVSCYQKETEEAQESDESYKSDLYKDIPTDTSSYDFTKPSYWLRWTTYLNLVSILPLHWCVGLITPAGAPVKLPVVYVHLKTVSFGGFTLVIFLSVCGLAISPSLLLIDGHGGIKSTWLLLFRGGNVLIEQNEGSVSVPTGFVLPQSVNENVATFDTKPELTALAPMLQDAYPPFDRMRLTNPAFLKFLNSCCTKARLFQGLMPL